MKTYRTIPVSLFCLLSLLLHQQSLAQQPAKGQTLPGETVPVSIVSQGPIAQINIATDQKDPAANPSAVLGWQTIMTEDFEGAFPNTLWTTFVGGLGTTDAFWDDSSQKPHTGSASAWCAAGGTQAGPPGGPYPNDMDARMIYGPFDLSDANDATLDFYLWNISQISTDYVSWLASKDNANYSGFATSGNSGGWVSKSFDLTNVPTLGDLTGESQVWIMFRFGSNGSTAFEGAYVDDILLQKNVGTPDITVSPTSFNPTVDEGQSTNDVLTIGNVGTDDLNWTLSITENAALLDATARPMAQDAARYFEQAPGGPSLAQAVGDLQARVASAGKLPIIVGFRAAFQPEGYLDAAEVLQQRQAIETRREALLDDLAAFDINPVKRFETIPYVAMSVNEEALQFLATHPDVVQVEEDVAHPPTLAESIPLIGADNAWAMGYTGAGQTVAILDTGVDGAHTFLAGKVVSEACYSTTNASAVTVCPNGLDTQIGPGAGVNCDLAVSGCNHGTHVAGIAAGTSVSFSGVAKDADIIAIQVFSRFNSPGDCGSTPAPCARTYSSDQILGLERVYALRTSFDIASANMSLGGGMFTAPCDGDSRKTAIDNLRSADIATAISSGNDGFTNATGAPGCISTAVTVGSTDDGSGGTTADDVSPFSNSASFVDLLAPGRWINSSVPGGGFSIFQGTSMSAPHVAGAWAVLKEKDPNATVDDILNALTTTGVPVTDSRNGLIIPRIQVDDALDPPTWLFASPIGGTVAQGGPSDMVTVTFDATNLTAGPYTGMLTITSNDPDESPLDIPVTLTVNAVGSATRYVAMGGSDAANDCTNPGSPCATIAHAVSEADAGDTLNIEAGTYAEPPPITKALHFITTGGPVIVE